MIGIRKKNNQAGFSLMEVIISVSLFAVIMMSMTEIFQLVINGQRTALASQNVQESLKYFLEVTAKEIRMARKSDGTCVDIPVGQTFIASPDLGGQSLRFTNYYGECVTYSLNTDAENNQRFWVRRGLPSGFISPAKIRIDYLHFVVSDATNTQPMVSMSLKAWATNQERFRSEMVLSTSLTSRYYK